MFYLKLLTIILMFSLASITNAEKPMYENKFIFHAN